MTSNRRIAAASLCAGLAIAAGVAHAQLRPGVVATVAGEPVTVQDLRQELAAMGAPENDPKANDTALREIIARRLVAQRARKEGMDKAADFSPQMRRGEESLLVQAYQRKLAEAVSNPSQTEVAAFVASHPQMFAERRIFYMDQLVATPTDSSLERFKSVRSLAEARRALDSENTLYRESFGVIDTLVADPQTVEMVAKSVGNDIVITPARGGGVTFNQVAQVRSVPFTGAAATSYAASALRAERGRMAVRDAMQVMLKDAESSIVRAPGLPATVPAAKSP